MLRMELIDPELWNLATVPTQASVLSLVPENIRKIGLKVTLGIALTKTEKQALIIYRNSDDLLHEAIRARKG